MHKAEYGAPATQTVVKVLAAITTPVALYREGLEILLEATREAIANTKMAAE